MDVVSDSDSESAYTNEVSAFAANRVVSIRTNVDKLWLELKRNSDTFSRLDLAIFD